MNGWRTVRLGDIASLITKGTTPTTMGFQYVGKGVNFVKVESISSDGKLIPKKFAAVSEECHHAFKRSQIFERDILFSIAGALGRCAIATNDFLPANTNQAVAIVRLADTSASLPEYVLYALKSGAAVEQIEGNRAGSAQQNLSLRQLSDFTIPLPSPKEQRRIVALLDEAFAAIATATANAEKNLANARDLLGSMVTQIFATTVESVRMCDLEEFCERGRIITYGVIKLGDALPDGVPCLRTSNVRWLRFDLNGMKSIHPDLSNEYRRTILKGGEVLVNVRGTLGGVAVVPPTMAGWNVSREIAVVPCDLNHVNSAFLAYWIGTAESQKWLTGVLKGAAYTGINISDLRTLPIPVLPIERQNEIVEKLDDCFEVGRRLVDQYVEKLITLTALKQSLLHRAFTGELTAIAPNLIAA